MEATINSAVFSHKFGNSPEVSVHNVVADGVQYQCWAPSILNKIGQKVQFDVIPNKDPKYPARMKLSEAAGGYSGGGKKPFTPFVPAFKDTREGFIASNRNMLVSYSKDLANAYSQVVIPKSFSEVLDNVKAAFEVLSSISKLEDIPEATIPSQSSVPAPIEYHLKPVLETILKGKFKSNNLTNNRDIIEYCANFGVEIKNDPNSGDVFINKLSEADANLLINELNRV
jgi:hypothetical protein